ncbi:MAG: hypothetical protein C0483_02240 [Pirellula sp.]|nr:hypothetical protein [Pirellula sp.]
MTTSELRQRLARFAVLLTMAAFVVGLSATVASHLVARQIAPLLARLKPAETPLVPARASPVVELGFYEATGIRREQLEGYLKEVVRRDHLDDYPAHLTFENARGDCLVDYPVKVLWDGGSDLVTIGSSGVLRIMLRPELLPGLRFGVPPEYVRIRQWTIPLGVGHEEYRRGPDPVLGGNVVNDYELQMEVWRQLSRQRAAGPSLSRERWQEQIVRTRCDWKPAKPNAPSGLLDAATIYRQKRQTVVIVAHLLPDGEVIYAAGVVVDPSGVIATACHVVDKPTAVARTVLTFDGQAFPVQEILAADRIADVALIRVDAENLVAATLSAGDPEGSPLTIVSHPAAEFYSVTEGLLRRYQSSVTLGKQTVQMSVTADFVDGASGGPVFNARGEVAGIVSARRRGTEHELAKIAAPAAAIRALSADAP